MLERIQDWERRETSFVGGLLESGIPTLYSAWRIIKTLKVCQPYDPDILLLLFTKNDGHSTPHILVQTWFFFATLFIKSRKQKQTNCPTINK